MLNKFMIVFILVGFLVGCGRLSQPTEPEGTIYPYPYGVTQNVK